MFTRIDALCDFLQLTAVDRQKILMHSDFPLRLPRRLAERIKKGTLDDPILRQFVPLTEEGDLGGSVDPLQEMDKRVGTERLLSKYSGRVLLLTTGACVMNCRYCFRRHGTIAEGGWAQELEWIRTHDDVKEVILSGGDPLSLPNHRLQALFDALNAIPHLRRIRIHTRVPIGRPERIDTALVTMLQNSRKRVIFVLHTNHANELGNDLFDALQRLSCPILSQSVLLKGVNDSVEALEALFETLVDNGIIPYYLHQLDDVQGARHFFVPEARGQALIEELKKRLSGYAVPRYVREDPARPYKVDLFKHPCIHN